jgi:hypothetical protein
MTTIAIRRQDGGVSIMRLAEEAAVDAEIAKWQQVHPGEYASHATVEEGVVPADRAFRNAWGHDLKVDMPKARSLWRDKMRVARAPKLQALDVDYQRADERGSAQDKADIAAQKQTLRDVTQDPAIDAATTPEALKAVWPDCLKD